MPLVLDATVGGANSNSFLTVDEATAYFESRVDLSPAWTDFDLPTQTKLLVMATRVLSSLTRPFKTFVPDGSGGKGYYRVRRQWTGSPATATQKLPWPRLGMLDGNGNVIPETVNPDELKWATAELAGQLGKQDRTLDNDVIVQGIKSASAGPVSVSFKDSITPQVIPDAVYDLLVQSWLTDELILPVYGAEIEVFN